MTGRGAATGKLRGAAGFAPRNTLDSREMRAALRLLDGRAMKRALAVLLLGIGIVGVSMLAGRRGADERYEKAKKAVDADCRAFRSRPERRNADICRIDPYAPKSIPLYTQAAALVDQAKSALAHGELHAAESDLSRAIAFTDDFDRMGTTIAKIVSVSIVKRVLDLAETHPEIDAARLLRDVHFETKHPFAEDTLNHRWYLAHWNELPAGYETHPRSIRDLADAMENDPAIYAEMERALVERHDVKECEALGREHDLEGYIFCDKIDIILETAARLDALQAGRLSSAAR